MSEYFVGIWLLTRVFFNFRLRANRSSVTFVKAFAKAKATFSITAKTEVFAVFFSGLKKVCKTNQPTSISPACTSTKSNRFDPDPRQSQDCGQGLQNRENPRWRLRPSLRSALIIRNQVHRRRIHRRSSYPGSLPQGQSPWRALLRQPQLVLLLLLLLATSRIDTWARGVLSVVMDSWTVRSGSSLGRMEKSCFFWSPFFLVVNDQKSQNENISSLLLRKISSSPPPLSFRAFIKNKTCEFLKEKNFCISWFPPPLPQYFRRFTAKPPLFGFSSRFRIIKRNVFMLCYSTVLCTRSDRSENKPVFFWVKTTSPHITNFWWFLI